MHKNLEAPFYLWDESQELHLVHCNHMGKFIIENLKTRDIKHTHRDKLSGWAVVPPQFIPQDRRILAKYSFEGRRGIGAAPHETIMYFNNDAEFSARYGQIPYRRLLSTQIDLGAY